MVLCLQVVMSAMLAQTTLTESFGEGYLPYGRIDFGNLDDRRYLLGMYYPPASESPGPPTTLAWSPRNIRGPWGEGPWLQTLPAWSGGLVQVPVVPGYTNTVAMRLRPSADTHFAFYCVNTGRSRAGSLDGDTKPVAVLPLSADRDQTARFDLTPEIIAGRDRVALYYRPSDAEASPNKPAVGFRTYWIRTALQSAPGAEQAIARYRALEDARQRQTRFTLTADSFVKPGEAFKLSLVARTPGGYADETYEGTLNLFSNSPDLAVPESVTFTKADRGIKCLDALTCAKAGDFIIRAHVPGDLAKIWRSNYVICDPNRKYRLLWGDLHVHTNLSDGYQDLDYAYRFARDVSKLDFIGVNDHDTWIDSAAWEQSLEKAAEYNQPGAFVTFPGFEWTSTVRGHHNVWFPTDRVPGACQPTDTYYSRPVSELETAVGDCGAVFSSHHLHPRSDFTDWDPRREPVIEIYSLWGSSERKNEPIQTIIQEGVSLTQEPSLDAITVLDRGIKVGFIAGSDSHVTAPGSNVGQPYWVGVCPYRRPGIAAIYAEENTRESIIGALRARRCYGAMNERIILSFEANGHVMGEEFTTDGPVHIRAKAWGAGPIASAVIIRNGQPLHSPVMWGETDRLDFEFQDNATPEGTSYYYLRVQQLMDGEYVNAWSSPIWVTKTRPASQQPPAR